MSDYRALHAYAAGDAESYDERRFTSPRGRLVDRLEWRLLSRGLSCLERQAGSFKTVLDVPVGTGRMARRLQQAGWQVTAVDASADMLQIAARRCPGLRPFQGRFEQLPLDDAGVDVAVSVRLLGHLPPEARRAGMAELGRVARVGAVVFFPGDSYWLEHRRRRQAARGRFLDHWYPLSKEDISDAARCGRFEVLRVLCLLGPVAETRALVLRKQT